MSIGQTSSGDRTTEAFNRGLSFAPLVFGHIAFRKYTPPGRPRAPINRGLFETETVALARRSKAELEKLSSQTEIVVSKFHNEFETNKEFSDALLYATGRGSASHTRLDVLTRILDEALNA